MTDLDKELEKIFTEFYDDKDIYTQKIIFTNNDVLDYIEFFLNLQEDSKNHPLPLD